MEVSYHSGDGPPTPGPRTCVRVPDRASLRPRSPRLRPNRNRFIRNSTKAHDSRASARFRPVTFEPEKPPRGVEGIGPCSKTGTCRRIGAPPQDVREKKAAALSLFLETSAFPGATSLPKNVLRRHPWPPKQPRIPKRALLNHRTMPFSSSCLPVRVQRHKSVPDHLHSAPRGKWTQTGWDDSVAGISDPLTNRKRHTGGTGEKSNRFGKGEKQEEGPEGE